jgi:hypothetical protein
MVLSLGLTRIPIFSRLPWEETGRNVSFVLVFAGQQERPGADTSTKLGNEVLRG